MLKSELLELLKEIGDDQQINETIQNVEGLIKPFDASKLALDDFKKLISENETIKGYYIGDIDRAVQRGVATNKKKYEEEIIPKRIEEAVKAKSNEGKNEWQIKYEEMQKENEKMKLEKVRAERKNEYTKTLNEKGLSPELVDFIYNDDTEVFNSNLEKISNIITTQINDGVNNKLTTSSYTPPKDEGGQVLDGVTKAFLERNPDITL